jgi:hypothetical protein
VKTRASIQIPFALASGYHQVPPPAGQGGDAESILPQQTIPAGLHIIPGGDIHGFGWAVSDPVLNDDQFSMFLYCSPGSDIYDQLFQSCSVYVDVCGAAAFPLPSGKTFPSPPGPPNALDLRQTLPHVVAGGEYQTSITIVNRSGVSATVDLRFAREDPTTHTTQNWTPAVLGNRRLQGVVLPAESVYTVETVEQNRTAIVGWAEIISDGPIDGSAVLRRQAGGTIHEASLPMNTGGAQRVLLPFDNRPGFSTFVALTNISDSDAPGINAVFHSATGAVIRTETMDGVPARGHIGFSLADEFPYLRDRQGLAEFSVPPGTASLSAIGLHFTPTGSFTPLVATTASVSTQAHRTIPHVVAGGNSQTSITLVNSGREPVTVDLRFAREDPTTHTTQNWIPAVLGNRPLKGIVLPAEVVYTVETAEASRRAMEGWVEIQSTASVDGFGVLRRRLGREAAQEASVPIDIGGARRMLLPFDNRNGRRTSMALANSSDTNPASVTAVFRTPGGAVIRADMLPPIPTQGHLALSLSDVFPYLEDQQGLAEFTVLGAASVSVSAIGLRFDPSGSFTTFAPVTALQAVDCVEGVWRENNANSFGWIFSVSANIMYIQRNDNFVRGEFVRAEANWTGELHWGNGEIWKNVELKPTPSCDAVGTNQSWSYRK